MIRTLLLMWLLWFWPFASPAAESSGGVPQIQCDISLTTWCITTFSGSVSMETRGGARVWRLQARTAASLPAMTITEAKTCSDTAEEVIERVGDRTLRQIDGIAFESAVYRLNANGCTLTFLWPAGDAGALYKQFVLFGILVGYRKETQLFKVEEQIR
jgi:hypothetical protein